ncbi:DUF2202 domain-containing protein [Candidatus Oscillochloris fontis]|uniref:DUF2202 domain-containing protein n=1 Tax=Candidatus Oscillochloris fontis TaxID=2496868 RepID=UPI001375D1F4|nr:DUF2202 domain-containing protein [Candidatus Oscillochloris fontis]
MKRTFSFIIAGIAGLIIALLALPFVTNAFAQSAPPDLAQVARPVATTSPPTALSAEDAEALIYMREEEKLARDVYLFLGQTWSLPIFENIAASEQTHMDALKTLLDRYGLSDPAATTAAGEFNNPDLQALYTQLVARGQISLSEALAVGAAIEEIDILDLQQHLTATTPADITQVFQNLVAGSENHLRAFVRQWEAQTGSTYQPQYLDAASYQAIMNAENTNGSGNSNGRGNGRRGRP